MFSTKQKEKIYAIWDSLRLRLKGGPILFVDCGANLGQGFHWFRKYYCYDKVSFELFEPNPHCFQRLEKLKCDFPDQVKLHNFAIGTCQATAKFFGLSSGEGGDLSEGGSIVQSHNSLFYEASADKAVQVQVIDFSEYILERSNDFKNIVVKMDIEGAELDVLEKMIADGSINHLTILYVEFHSHYKRFPERELAKSREAAIVKALSSLKVNVRLWH